MYNVWDVPPGMENAVKKRLLRADQCLDNVIVGNAEEAEAWLAKPLKRLLLTGSPNEHVLQISCDEESLPDGAAKHLLGIA